MEEGREPVLLRPGCRGESSEDRNSIGGVRSQCGGTLLGEANSISANNREPQSVVKEEVRASAEQILLYGKRSSRLIHLEANVIGYFGRLLRASVP